MLQYLAASRPAQQRRTGHVVLSLVCHATMFMVAFEATRAVAKPVAAIVADTTLVFLTRLKAPETRAPIGPAPRARTIGMPGGRGPSGPAIVLANPPPKGFQTISAPVVMPTAIPPVNLNERAIDPRDYTGRGQEGGVGWGVVGGTGSADQAAPSEVVEAGYALDRVYTAEEKHASFKPARLLSQVAPKYPRRLEELGVNGTVVIRFVVDTSGIVMDSTITVIEATVEAFGVAARDAIARALFEPAMLGERPVRQLATQKINFVAMR